MASLPPAPPPAPSAAAMASLSAVVAHQSASSSASSSGSPLRAAQESLAAQMAPVILCLCTAKVDDICNRNGVDFVDLLRPFARVTGLSVPVSIGESSTVIRDVSVRLMREDELSTRTSRLDERLSVAVRDALTEAVDSRWRGIVDREDAAQCAGELVNAHGLGTRADEGASLSTPWYHVLRHEYMSELGASDHEYLDHPVACLSVVSTECPNVVASAAVPQSRLPMLYREHHANANMPVTYVLVHDNSAPGAPNAESTFRTLCDAYGAQNCMLLRLNSALVPVSEGSTVRVPVGPSVRDVWTPALPRIQAAGVTSDDIGLRTGACGTGLTVDDVTRVASFMREYVSRTLLPYLYKRAAALHQSIESSRKGFRNQFKAWWRSSGKSKSDDEYGGYPFQAPEAQIRLLADYLFFLRLYEVAYANYKLGATDYKSDGAWKHQAGALEMMGVCLFMAEPARRDIDLNLDTAYGVYAKYGWKVLATRVSMRLAMVHKTRGAHRDAAAVLLRASLVDSSDVRVALLTEEAALCYLQSSPAYFRKFSFYLVLAGHRFAQAALRRHALRVYRTASESYGDREWTLIDDNINMILGRLSAVLGDLPRAITYYTKLLSAASGTNARTHPQRQQTFLREFMNVARAMAHAQSRGASDCATIPELPLPEINTRHVGFSVRDASGEAVAEWRPMLAALLGENSQALHRVMTSQARLHCPMWEEVFVDIDVHNPLLIALNMTEVQLIAKLEPSAAGELHPSQSAPSLVHELASATAAAAAAAGAESAPRNGASDGGSLEASAADVSGGSGGGGDPLRAVAPRSADDLEPALAASASSGELAATAAAAAAPAAAAAAAGAPAHSRAHDAHSLLELETMTVHLSPDERLRIRLYARPRVEGTLTITGVSYKLGDAVRGERHFELQGKRLNRSKQHYGGTFYERDTRNVVQVLGAMPLLEVTFRDFPSRLNVGGMRPFSLTLRNAGHQRLVHCRLALSHPTFVCRVDGPVSWAAAAAAGTPGAGAGPDSPALGQQRYSVTGLAGLVPWTAWHAASDESGSDGGTPPQRARRAGTTAGGARCAARPTRLGVLSLAQSLEPGETKDVTLWVRGEKVGRQVMRFLFAYEAENPLKDLRYRFERRTAVCDVLPLLSLAPRLVPTSRWAHAFALALQLDLAPTVSPGDVVVEPLQLVCLSSRWVVRAVSGVQDGVAVPGSLVAWICARDGAGSGGGGGGDGGDDVPPASLALAPSTPTSQMAVALGVLPAGAPATQAAASSGAAAARAVSSISLMSGASSAAQVPMPVDPESPSALFHEHRGELSMLLRWRVVSRATGSVIEHGQTSLSPVHLSRAVLTAAPVALPGAGAGAGAVAGAVAGPSSAGAAPRPSLAHGGAAGALPALLCNMRSASSVRHNFGARPLCVLPVQVEVTNGAESCGARHVPGHPCERAYDVMVQALAPQERDAFVGVSSPTYQYFWSGATRGRVHRVPCVGCAGEQHVARLSLDAVFARPGVYSLTRVRVLARAVAPGDEAVPATLVDDDAAGSASAGGGGGGGGGGDAVVVHVYPLASHVVRVDGGDA